MSSGTVVIRKKKKKERERVRDRKRISAFKSYTIHLDTNV